MGSSAEEMGDGAVWNGRNQEEPDVPFSRLLGTELGAQATLRLSCPRDEEGVRQAPPACQAAGKVRWRRTLKVDVTVEGEDF